MTVTDARCTVSTHARTVHDPHRWWPDDDTGHDKGHQCDGRVGTCWACGGADIPCVVCRPRPERTDDADAERVIVALDELTMALPHPDHLPARICSALNDLAVYLAPMRRRWCEVEGPHESHPSTWGGDICPGAVPEDLGALPVSPHPRDNAESRPAPAVPGDGEPLICRRCGRLGDDHQTWCSVRTFAGDPPAPPAPMGERPRPDLVADLRRAAECGIDGDGIFRWSRPLPELLDEAAAALDAQSTHPVRPAGITDELLRQAETHHGDSCSYCNSAGDIDCPTAAVLDALAAAPPSGDEAGSALNVARFLLGTVVAQYDSFGDSEHLAHTVGLIRTALETDLAPPPAPSPSPPETEAQGPRTWAQPRHPLTGKRNR